VRSGPRGLGGIALAVLQQAARDLEREGPGAEDARVFLRSEWAEQLLDFAMLEIDRDVDWHDPREMLDDLLRQHPGPAREHPEVWIDAAREARVWERLQAGEGRAVWEQLML